MKTWFGTLGPLSLVCSFRFGCLGRLWLVADYIGHEGAQTTVTVTIQVFWIFPPVKSLHQPDLNFEWVNLSMFCPRRESRSPSCPSSKRPLSSPSSLSPPLLSSTSTLPLCPLSKICLKDLLRRAGPRSLAKKQSDFWVVLFFILVEKLTPWKGSKAFAGKLFSGFEGLCPIPQACRFTS